MVLLTTTDWVTTNITAITTTTTAANDIFILDSVDNDGAMIMDGLGC
jgi:hypothetical protein